MLIDCDACSARGPACGDCVVSVMLGAPPEGVEVDETERRALEVLAGSGLVPRLRLHTVDGHTVDGPGPDGLGGVMPGVDMHGGDMPGVDMYGGDGRTAGRPVGRGRARRERAAG